MEPFGYLITEHASDALELFVDKRVRYAAQLEDGSGFVAFDGQPGVLIEFGNVHMATQDIVPWPWAAPKRGIGTGREVFSLVPSAFADYLREQECVTGAVSLGPDAILVESDGPIAGGVWTSRVIAYRDKRLATHETQVGVLA